MKPAGWTTWFALAALLGAPEARGDGGTVQLVERHGTTRIAVFSAPNPLRAGPVDISVLVQDADSGAPADAELWLSFESEAGGETIVAPASREAATNKLMQSALVELPSAGRWHLKVHGARGEQEFVCQTVLAVGPPLSPWLSEWTWFTWPLAAVGLFGMHRYLVGRRVK